MSKKDYGLIEQAVRSIESEEVRGVCARALARVLAVDNSRFALDRFLVGCGVGY